MYHQGFTRSRWFRLFAHHFTVSNSINVLLDHKNRIVKKSFGFLVIDIFSCLRFWDSNSENMATASRSTYELLNYNTESSSSWLSRVENSPDASKGLSASSCFSSKRYRFLSELTSKLSAAKCGHSILKNTSSVSSYLLLKRRKRIEFSFKGGIAPLSQCRCLSYHVDAEPSTSDGLTVDGIIAKQWTILNENDIDWKSHAAAIAQSINVIKKRLQWNQLMIRLDILSTELNKADIWDDPVRAGRISREHGSLMGKMKEVKEFERELLEHIDMLKLAREENDRDLESVGSHFL